MVPWCRVLVVLEKKIVRPSKTVSADGLKKVRKRKKQSERAETRVGLVRVGCQGRVPVSVTGKEGEVIEARLGFGVGLVMDGVR